MSVASDAEFWASVDRDRKLNDKERLQAENRVLAWQVDSLFAFIQCRLGLDRAAAIAEMRKTPESFLSPASRSGTGD